MVEELAEEGHPAVERGRQPDVGREVGNGKIGTGRHAWARNVGYRQAVAENAVAHGVGSYCGGVVRGLVDDQVADDARLRVEHDVADGGLRVRRRHSAGRAGAEEVGGLHFGGVKQVICGAPNTVHTGHRCDARHDEVGGAHAGRDDVVSGAENAVFARVVGQDVVPGAINGAQTIGKDGNGRDLSTHAANVAGKGGGVDLALTSRVDDVAALGDFDLLEYEIQVLTVDGEVVLRLGGHFSAPEV